MRARIWILVGIALVLLAMSACTGSQVSRKPVGTPIPTKTLRPTFTPTPMKPTLTPTPEEPTATPTPEAPTATPVPPTPEPTATPEAATFTVTSATLNVRSGPSTNYGVIGQIRQGQTFPITGKNPAGNWWQFDYNGRVGWVSGQLVRVTNAELVQVAQNIPAPPTARPRPTAAPRPAATQPPPAPPPSNTKYAAFGTGQRIDTNNWVTIYCILYDRSGNNLLPGTIRVLRDGQVVAPAVSFTQFPTFYLDSGYNAGCKVELQPAINGNYTAVLIEGDQVVSDPISFNVTGEANRITFVAWKQK